MVLKCLYYKSPFHIIFCQNVDIPQKNIRKRTVERKIIRIKASSVLVRQFTFFGFLAILVTNKKIDFLNKCINLIQCYFIKYTICSTIIDFIPAHYISLYSEEIVCTVRNVKSISLIFFRKIVRFKSMKYFTTTLKQKLKNNNKKRLF